MNRPGSPVPRNAKPHGGNRRASGAAMLESVRALYGSKTASRIPDNWRDRLPDPAAYYGQHVAKLGRVNATGWAQGTCPFHEDGNKSLSVHVADGNGGWRCFASCGGGDLLGFHQRLTGKAFKDAVRDLIGGGR
jgi:hypothetical protein